MGENNFCSFILLQHFTGACLTGIPVFAGVIAEEKINKLTELTDSSIKRMADFLTGINSEFWGKTKIIVKSYSAK